MLDSVSDYSFTDCPECGIRWAMPKHYFNDKHQNKGSFHCPNGHSLSYKESELDRVWRERDLLKQQQARLIDEKNELAAQARKAEAATKRLQKRTAAGACPCCQRSFSNMRAHLANKHPEFVAENVTKLKVVK